MTPLDRPDLGPNVKVDRPDLGPRVTVEYVDDSAQTGPLPTLDLTINESGPAALSEGEPRSHERH
ncbi:MAG: hypothetical protein QOG85_516 [Gaiellaceae bacterium]|jgi:hypothetical protein|nr:hypothetical protein [Gaiellaceae bacterium]